ncbi:methyltransferase family protein [Candidatus Neomarinimicrobiota bacterium]
MDKLATLIFKLRGFTPVPLALFILWQADSAWPYWLVGIGLMLAGELIRLTALRASGKATRTRNVGAKRLVTWGLYAYTRNPLYIGNFLLWLGATIFAYGPYFKEILLILLVLFFIQYTLIIYLEEKTLAELFGEEYDLYCQKVPRLFPTLSPTGSKGEKLHSWWYAFQSEQSSLVAFLVVILGALVSTYMKQ